MSNVSPTLTPGERFLSVVAPVPSALGRRVTSWQTEYEMPATTLHTHITVFLSPEPTELAVIDELSGVVQKCAEFKVELGEPTTFLPESPVSFLPVEAGRSEFDNLNKICAEVLGTSASPFPYVPHVTLGLRVDEETLQKSLYDFAGLDERLTSFTVDRVELYSFDGDHWSHLKDLYLSPAH